MPISLVRSVTETSMMFITTMPPTTSAMPGTASATMKMVPKRLSRRPVMRSGVKTPKLSFSPGFSPRRMRINSFASSTASLKRLSSLAVPTM